MLTSSILQVDIHSHVDIWKVALPRTVSHQRVIMAFHRTFFHNVTSHLVGNLSSLLSCRKSSI